MFYEFSTSSFCTGRSAFDIRKSIKYQDAKDCTKYEVLSTKYHSIFCTGRSAFDIGFDSVFRISYLVFRTFYHYLVPGTLYFPSTFCTGRSAFDIGFDSVFRISYFVSRISYFLSLLGSWYIVPSFFILHWAFSFRHWFRFRISYLVLSIPPHSCETHCPRPPLPTLPGVLYGTERSG
jgi:hypothetical protein